MAIDYKLIYYIYNSENQWIRSDLNIVLFLRYVPTIGEKSSYT